MWHKPWVSTDGGPVNIDSNRRYRGINVFLLEFTAMEKGYSSSRWGSYKQIAARGGQVRKGEKGTLVVFWKILRKEDKVDGETQVKKIPFLRHYTVFNEDQADWDDPETDKRRKPAERVERDPIEAAQELLTEYLATGPSLSHGGDRAFYVPSSDSIRLPHIGDFKSAEHYHSTLFHEVTHSTGHSKRLARDGIAQGSFGRFGDAVYSKEELIAEMGAAMLCGVAGIDQAATIPETAAYLAHWRDALRADNKLIVQAAAQAQKAADLVLGTTFDTNKEES
jgi:antirestriction protein ArdC